MIDDYNCYMLCKLTLLHNLDCEQFGPCIQTSRCLESTTNSNQLSSWLITDILYEEKRFVGIWDAEIINKKCLHPISCLYYNVSIYTFINIDY